ncbi:MGMT family protein [Methylobacterium sp. NEAU 140]|uniref:MGMT family protein n=1 Tax=Methylobacterium sp. NEAU 140 TaxID=3064945 RepID=UPI0027355CD6|nr:MGMT family protein [Methylobacterium sp. NEAU 140]MDP4025465.1 MGMT family protein [Methylobacterium sp. NEAU 140]
MLAETRRQRAADVVDALQTFALPLDFRGTAFQTAVRTALLAIPYGATRSDAEIARAVGAAGAPTGFAGGLARERHRPGLEGAGIFALAPPV